MSLQVEAIQADSGPTAMGMAFMDMAIAGLKSLGPEVSLRFVKRLLDEGLLTRDQVRGLLGGGETAIGLPGAS